MRVMVWLLVVVGLAAGSRRLAAQPLTVLARARVQAAVDAVRHDSSAIRERAWRREMRSADPVVARLATLGVATLARRTYRYPESDALLASLLPRGATLDAIGVQASLARAASLVTRWRPVEAGAALEATRRGAIQIGDSVTEGEVLAIMATFAARSGHRDSVRRLMRDAVARVSAGSSQAALFKCTEASFLRGEALRTADTLVTEGTALARSLGDTLVLARCLLVRGTLDEAQGSITRSSGPIGEAIALLRASKDLEGLGSAQQWMAYTLIQYAQEFGSGRRLAEQAIANGRQAQAPLVVAWAGLNLAQVALRVGDAVAARRAALDAQAAFGRLGDRQGELASRGILADALMLAGDVPAALATYEAVARQIAQMGGTNALSPNLLRQAAGHIELGNLSRAERLVDSSVALATSTGVQGIVVSSQHYWRGLIESRRGRYDAAIERFLQFKRGVGPQASHLNLDADLRIAEAFARSGRFEAAESVFTRGSASLDRMRGRAASRGDVLRLLTGQRYDTDTDLGIATTVAEFVRVGRLEAAFRIAESERARWLWTQRARRDAMARTKPDRGPLDDRMIDARDVQAALEPRTVVVSYVTGRGGEPTTAFVISATQLRAVVLPPIDSMTSDVERFVALLEGGSPATALARSLGKRLLDSVMRALPAGVRELRLVPDGPLHHLPFDALMLADGSRLLDHVAISRSPSARLAVAPSRPVAGGRIVAYGDPIFDSRYHLARLPGSADEARAVVRAGGGRGEARLRLDARAPAFREDRFDGVGVLHLATHARVQDWGLIDNAVFLGATSDDDGRIGADDLASMSLGVGLVVLSGCRTVGGLVATGEGVQGLVAPLLEAGVGAVVVTHWDIRDRSLIALMEDLYRGLAAGMTTSEALARAKRSSMRRGDSPTVWASVSLVGDGTLRPLVRASAASADGLRSAAVDRRRIAR
ncbi:MAG: CHAT domain-containing protein [Gemmatimonadaceae bacterium]|nr:CHAT domain-containing protein [Gemmatimonadaceae bacterium]